MCSAFTQYALHTFIQQLITFITVNSFRSHCVCSLLYVNECRLLGIFSELLVSDMINNFKYKKSKWKKTTEKNMFIMLISIVVWWPVWKKQQKKNCQIKYMQHWLEIAILWPFFVWVRTTWHEIRLSYTTIELSWKKIYLLVLLLIPLKRLNFSFKQNKIHVDLI